MSVGLLAALVGLPKKIIERAEEVLDINENPKNKKEIYKQTSLSFDFMDQEQESVIEERLKEIDPLKVTPLEALNILNELKSYLEESK